VIRLGLTGGAASGKSAVASIFAREGAIVVSADSIAHDLIEGKARDEIVAHFGEGILGPDRRVDRRALASRVFTDPGERGVLESILHPMIRAELERRFAEAVLGSPAGVFVVEAALIVETGRTSAYDHLLVVEAPEAQKVRRQMLARGLTEAEARARLRAQGSIGRKLLAADFVIWNDETEENLEKRAREVWARLRDLMS
jgi:dephospho-CoA kinase